MEQEAKEVYYRILQTSNDEDLQVLKKTSEEINLDDQKEMDEIAEAVGWMSAFLRKNSSALGISGVQIGVLKRFFVLHRWSNFIVALNPKIIALSPQKQVKEEACLSEINEDGGFLKVDVERHRKVSIEFYDITGEKRRKQFSGKTSLIIQHELDHLDGKLLSDRI